MEEEKENCFNNIYFIDTKGELRRKCRKHFCTCEQKYPYDADLDERYQRGELGEKFDNNEPDED